MALRRQSRAFTRLLTQCSTETVPIWQKQYANMLLPGASIARARPLPPCISWRTVLEQQRVAALHTSTMLLDAMPAPQERQEQQEPSVTPPSSSPQRDAHTTATLVDAQQCDQAIGTLQQTRQQTRRRLPGYASPARHVVNALTMLVNGTIAVLRWTLALPGRIVAFYMLPAAERSKTYAHWWSVVKKEARHYWVSVCGCLNSCVIVVLVWVAGVPPNMCWHGCHQHQILVTTNTCQSLPPTHSRHQQHSKPQQKQQPPMV